MKAWPRGVLFTTVAMVGAATVVGLYAANAGALCAYQWDWSPDEGLTLDAARRIVLDPGGLYTKQVVPYPWFYTPLLPILLAPLVTHFQDPLLVARLLAGSFTIVIVASVYALVRRRAPREMAIACSALALTPFDLTFWYMLVRMDGPMMALWLLAAIPLLPQRLENGADTLSWKRASAGAALLLAAVLTKQTAIIHGAPLVLGWALVDRRGMRRLVAVLLGLGLASLLLLQLSTGGGFLWVTNVWQTHPVQLPELKINLLVFWSRSWPILLFAAGAFCFHKGGPAALRDSSLLLVAGGLAILPALAKAGAWWSYLLPFHCAVVVAAGRWLGAPREDAPPDTLRTRALPALTTILAASLAFRGAFPLPQALDARTAAAFYDYVKTVAGTSAQPILAMWPDYAYYVVGQPVEMEASGFRHLEAAHVNGIERIRQRIEARAYGLIVWTPTFFPIEGESGRALARNYRSIGGCRLGFFFGPKDLTLMAPLGSSLEFHPPPGTRCGSMSAAADVAVPTEKRSR